VNTDTLIQAVANRQTERTISALNALLLQGENPVTLVRMVAKYFSNLLKGVDKMERGENPAEIAKKILKPSQFRLEESVVGQLRSWSKESLLRAHKTLLNAEVQMKSGGVDPELTLKQTLLMLTKL
jgi:DNA polymerase III delta subunit